MWNLCHSLHFFFGSVAVWIWVATGIWPPHHAKIRYATTTIARVLGCWQAADPIILFETEKPGPFVLDRRIGAAKHSSEIEPAEVP